MNPKKDATLPIRLSDEEKEALSQIAEESGLSASTIVRLLINAFIKHYEQSGKTFKMPLRFES